MGKQRNGAVLGGLKLANSAQGLLLRRGKRRSFPCGSNPRWFSLKGPNFTNSRSNSQSRSSSLKSKPFPRIWIERVLARVSEGTFPAMERGWWRVRGEGQCEWWSKKSISNDFGTSKCHSCVHTSASSDTELFDGVHEEIAHLLCYEPWKLIQINHICLLLLLKVMWGAWRLSKGGWLFGCL